MLYRLNDEFTKIEETEGLMQNLSKEQSVELVTCIENPQKDSGVVLQPKEKLKFTAKPDEFIYARCVENGGVMANLSVVNLAFASNANIKHDHDDRYYTEAEIDKLLAQLDFNQINDSEILTTKTWSSDKISKVLNKYYTKEEIDKLLQALNYCEIDDNAVVSNKTWSSQKISSGFNEKADKNHTHKEIIEELKGDIEEATKKAGLPVGFEYTISYTELQAGQLSLLGGKYLKSTYTDLWAWVQTHPSLIKTETKWQAMKTASGGRAVPFYADVDEQYLRVPLNTVWVKGASSVDEVGAVLEAGLPNITGNVISSDRGYASINCTGAYTTKTVTAANQFGAAGNQYGSTAMNFDASNSNAIYGNSDTVQPQSVVKLWVVQAFGTISNTGNLDMSGVAQGIEQLQTKVSNLENQTGFVVIYPNNGTSEKPGEVKVNNRYILENPFKGYEIDCKVEVMINNKWGTTEWIYSAGTNQGFGIIASHFLPDDKIILQTGAAQIVDPIAANGGHPFGDLGKSTTTAPCRVKVWKVGKFV